MKTNKRTYTTPETEILSLGLGDKVMDGGYVFHDPSAGNGHSDANWDDNGSWF